MRRPRPAGAIAGLVALVLAGCSRSPESRFYLLDQGGAVPSAGPALTAARGHLVFVDRVRVAAYLDRPQIVMRADPNRVTFAQFDVWAESLSDVITRSLVDALGAELGGDNVLVTPDRRDTDPAARITVDVLRFDADAQAVTLDARWTLLLGAEERFAGTGRELIVEPADAAFDARVTAFARAVQNLAQRLAPLIGTPPR